MQVYPQGWQRIRSLMSENPTAAKGLCSARRAYRPVLRGGGRQSGRSGGNGRRVREDHQEATAYLEEVLALVRIRVSGSVYAYALDPKEVWRAWDCQKEQAAF